MWCFKSREPKLSFLQNNLFKKQKKSLNAEIM